MTTDSMALLQDAVKSFGQAAVARAIGYSPSAVNQALKGTYGGRLDNLLRKVKEVYGDDRVVCPILGDISLSKCADERRRPFGISNPQRTRLWQACRTCAAHQQENV